MITARDAMLIDINGPPMPPGFIGYPPAPPMPQMPHLPPPTVTPFCYPTVCVPQFGLLIMARFHDGRNIAESACRKCKKNYIVINNGRLKRKT